MPSGVSVLSLTASGLYLLLVCVLVTAAMQANLRNQARWHFRSWATLACLFAALALARYFDIEDVMRDNLRELLRSEGAYADRRDYQRPIVAGLVAFGGIAGAVGFYRTARKIRKGRRNLAVMAANAAGLAMVGLLAMRLISLSAIDALLYGPMKLNWIADLGLTAVVAGAALFYLRLVRRTRR